MIKYEMRDPDVIALSAKTTDAVTDITPPIACASMSSRTHPSVTQPGPNGTSIPDLTLPRLHQETVNTGSEAERKYLHGENPSITGQEP